jgi:glutathione S-transferase
MKYISCAEAIPMKGLRLVLSSDGPNIWCEAAKYVFALRNVPYVAVRKSGMGDTEDNERLFQWTGQRNAPVAMYEDEKPRSGWLDILYLAERLGSGPSLLPDAREGQVECIGLSHQLCGEDGLGWNRRLNMFKMMLDAVGGDPARTGLPPRLFKDYTIDAQTAAAGTDRLLAILKLFNDRLKRQKAAGSRYLVGDRLTATDAHFAAMFGMVDPLPHGVNPMPAGMRGLYESGEPHVRAAVTDELREHRDYIYKNHLTLPIDFQDEDRDISIHPAMAG